MTPEGPNTSIAALQLPLRQDARWDAVALGEVMLRFDPGEERISATRNFRVWEGGGEYNVMRGLRRAFGLRTSIVTALVDNPVGRLLEDLLLQGGVDLSHVQWQPFDGIGRAARNGVYFLERGEGVRPGLGMMDRGHTAISQLRADDVDWQGLFRTRVCAGFTPAASCAGCRRRVRRWRRRRCAPRASTGRWCRSTAIIGLRFGKMQAGVRPLCV